MDTAKILLVDDDLKNLKLLKDYLLLKGYQVVIAQDGEEALKAMGAQSPDLVIMDLIMPNMNGWKTGLNFKQDPRYKHIPVVICSALFESDNDKPEKYEVGDVYIKKPIDLEHLVSVIKGLLDRSESR